MTINLPKYFKNLHIAISSITGEPRIISTSDVNTNLCEKYKNIDADIFLYGHTHVGSIERIGDRIIANPGSISLPKCNTAHSYIILDENKIILKDVDGKVIQEYEYEK